MKTEFTAVNTGIENGYLKFRTKEGSIFHVRLSDCDESLREIGSKAKIVYQSFGNAGSWYIAVKRNA